MAPHYLYRVGLCNHVIVDESDLRQAVLIPSHSCAGFRSFDEATHAIDHMDHEIVEKMGPIIVPMKKLGKVYPEAKKWN